ncbi:MAG TPA: hypothetical protein VMS71_01175, partial [Candidatus Acidoferrum sp.]|nr:hypothetical protein [Candidatus Acidoferrum sp.]
GSGNIRNEIPKQRSPKSFRTAREALLASRIDPAIVGGKPARCRVDITYDFVLDRSGRPVATTVQSVGEVSLNYPR